MNTDHVLLATNGYPMTGLSYDNNQLNGMFAVVWCSGIQCVSVSLVLCALDILCIRYTRDCFCSSEKALSGGKCNISLSDHMEMA